jgi:hypothetical protein
LIVAETLVVYPMRPVAPEAPLGVVFLPGLLAVWTAWGLALGAATALIALIGLASAVGDERRVREVVASVDALLRAARAREAMGSALAR